MIANPVPRLYVSFNPPEGETATAFRLPVVAFDNQGLALVAPIQHAAQPADALMLLAASALRTSLGDGWVARMVQDPAPTPKPVDSANERE